MVSLSHDMPIKGLAVLVHRTLYLTDLKRPRCLKLGAVEVVRLYFISIGFILAGIWFALSAAAKLLHY